MHAVKWRKFLFSKTANVFRYLFLVGTFALPDIWLRIQTRWIGAYSIYELAPNLFTLIWSILLTLLITAIPSRRAGQILFAAVYGPVMVLAAVQYGAYLALGRFLYVSDFALAGEGADYASWVIALLTPSFLLQVIALVMVGVLGIWLYPIRCRDRRTVGKYAVIRLLGLCACAAALPVIPGLYGSTGETEQWDDFFNPAFEYRHFSNVNFDMELTGLYQFFARDIQIQLSRGENREEQVAMIHSFFGQRQDHRDNAMTGILEGKNLIVVMMETVDDWLITQQDTPTLYRMMHEGIRFENFYTPQYSNGYTFNTEFAFNVSTYPYSNGNVAYSLMRNRFSSSAAARFAQTGYRVNSYHVGAPNYYNREQMHQAWGYEAYHSYQDYPAEHISYLDDRFLVESDSLYADITGGEPFFSFVITYSGHLPFHDEDEVAQIALKEYPMYDRKENREEAILRAKVRLTDDMFAGLLARLETDGLLEDTVIVGFGDHYAYGLSDRGHLQTLSEAAGDTILERTPAFIYCAGCDLSQKVEKVMQITDLAPTIMNLFGLKVPKEIMGQDIFDDQYGGYAIFSGGTWLTETTYVKNGVIQWNHGMSQDEIQNMNAYVQQVYQVNDAILDVDYYARED